MIERRLFKFNVTLLNVPNRLKSKLIFSILQQHRPGEYRCGTAAEGLTFSKLFCLIKFSETVTLNPLLI